jgi:homoserine kinase type II
LPYLDDAQAALIRAELAYQNHLAASSLYAALPLGPVHADLFRDNVLFGTHPAGPELTAIFDFYFAGRDTYVFDIAVALNDWCVDLNTGASLPAHAEAFLNAYQRVRPLSGAEWQALPAMRRAGALRFWISRLWDFHLPRQASMLKAHDPGHFERVLREQLRVLACN